MGMSGVQEYQLALLCRVPSLLHAGAFLAQAPSWRLALRSVWKHQLRVSHLVRMVHLQLTRLAVPVRQHQLRSQGILQHAVLRLATAVVSNSAPRSWVAGRRSAVCGT